VRVGDPPRADVDVLPFVEGADLTLTADLGVAQCRVVRPRQSADAVAGFEEAEVVAEFVELVCR
jgi:hypothetical protein